jgi:hypothetical protein
MFKISLCWSALDGSFFSYRNCSFENAISVEKAFNLCSDAHHFETLDLDPHQRKFRSGSASKLKADPYPHLYIKVKFLELWSVEAQNGTMGLLKHSQWRHGGSKWFLGKYVDQWQCCGSGSGIRCLFDPWIRDPE